MGATLDPRLSARRTPLTRESDERLLELAQDGDEAAFEALVRRYRPALLAHCRRVGGDAVAQDALQTTVIGAWHSLRRRVEVRHVRAWLFTIAHRAAVQALRDRLARPQELTDAIAGGRSPHEHVEQAERACAALTALARLPEREREVLVSSSLHGRSGRDIALELGIAEGAVRQLVFRARERARAGLSTLLPMPFLARVRGVLAGRARSSAALARRFLLESHSLAAPTRLARVLAAAALAGASATAVRLSVPDGATRHATPRTTTGVRARPAPPTPHGGAAASSRAVRSGARSQKVPATGAPGAFAGSSGHALGGGGSARAPAAAILGGANPSLAATRPGRAARAGAGTIGEIAGAPLPLPPVAAPPPPEVVAPIGKAAGGAVGAHTNSTESLARSAGSAAQAQAESAQQKLEGTGETLTGSAPASLGGRLAPPAAVG